MARERAAPRPAAAPGWPGVGAQLAARGATLDSRAPRLKLSEYMYSENRFKMLTMSDPETAKELLEKAELFVHDRWAMYEHMANRPVRSVDGNGKNGK